MAVVPTGIVAGVFPWGLEDIRPSGICAKYEEDVGYVVDGAYA